MRRRIVSVIRWFVVIALAAASTPSAARACSPLYPAGITHALPSGDAWPANAPLIFEGGQLAVLPDMLFATIDGAPVEIEIDALRSRYLPSDYGHDLLALRLRPAPEPGQTVRVEGSLCFSGCPVAIEYVASARIAPEVPPVDALRWDLEEHQREPDSFHENSCGVWWDPLAEVLTRVLVPTTADALDGWHRLEVSVSRGAGEVLDTRLLDPRDGYAVTNVWLTQPQVGYPADLAGLCVSARLITATTEGPVTTICEPCRVRGPMDALSCAPPDGHCPFEATDSSSEEPPPPCGGCAVGSRPAAPAGVLGGLLFLFCARRRR